MGFLKNFYARVDLSVIAFVVQKDYIHLKDECILVKVVKIGIVNFAIVTKQAQALVQDFEIL